MKTKIPLAATFQHIYFKTMKYKILILFLFIHALSFSQTKLVNKDSLKWEKENLGWEKRIFDDPEFVNKLEVSKSDKSIDLYMSMRKEYRIFGYQKPNRNSKKMILLSIWTFDVKDNPSNCPFGSYYETASMGNKQLEYIRMKNSFIEAAILKDKKQITKVYFEKKWVKYVE